MEVASEALTMGGSGMEDGVNLKVDIPPGSSPTHVMLRNCKQTKYKQFRHSCKAAKIIILGNENKATYGSPESGTGALRCYDPLIWFPEVHPVHLQIAPFNLFHHVFEVGHFLF